MIEAPPTQRYLGKYRATVTSNVDPQQRGRLQLSIPDVLAFIPSTWAEACLPLAGPTGPPMGFFLVPPVGAGVWAEFEHGDPEKPVWIGCRWGATSDLPTIAKTGLPASPPIVMQTLGQNFISVSDAKGPTGGILLKTLSGAFLSINDVTGITLSDGKGGTINLLNGVVAINKDALLVNK